MQAVVVIIIQNVKDVRRFWVIWWHRTLQLCYLRSLRLSRRCYVKHVTLLIDKLTKITFMWFIYIHYLITFIAQEYYTRVYCNESSSEEQQVWKVFQFGVWERYMQYTLRHAVVTRTSFQTKKLPRAYFTWKSLQGLAVHGTREHLKEVALSSVINWTILRLEINR